MNMLHSLPVEDKNRVAGRAIDQWPADMRAKVEQAGFELRSRRIIVRQSSRTFHLADDRIKRAIGVLRWPGG